MDWGAQVETLSRGMLVWNTALLVVGVVSAAAIIDAHAGGGRP